jgi:hypothetical protein
MFRLEPVLPLQPRSLGDEPAPQIDVCASIALLLEEPRSQDVPSLLRSLYHLSQLRPAERGQKRGTLQETLIEVWHASRGQGSE